MSNSKSLKTISNKSISALILIIIGTVVQFVTIEKFFDISLEGSNYIIASISLALPGIFIAAVVGAVVGLIAQLFSRRRARDKFFLIFSIFFLLTIIVIADGSSVGNKINKEEANANDSLELSKPYISSVHDFSVAFPTEPEYTVADYSPYGIDGGMAIYIATKKTDGGDVVYYVFVNDLKPLKFADKISRRNYYEQSSKMPPGEAAAEIIKISLITKNVYNDIEGIEYKYRLTAEGDVFFKRGIDFIDDGKGYQVSIIYEAMLDSQIEGVYSAFASSFSLL